MTVESTWPQVGVQYFVDDTTTRQDMIEEIHDRLSALATEAGFTASEGSYGRALDAALRAMLDGSTDATEIQDEQLNTLYDVFEMCALKKLRNYYTTQVDVSVGPRRESLSQIVAAIDKRLREFVHTVTVKYDYDELDISGATELPTNWFELGYTQPGI